MGCLELKNTRLHFFCCWKLNSWHRQNVLFFFFAYCCDFDGFLCILSWFWWPFFVLIESLNRTNTLVPWYHDVQRVSGGDDLSPSGIILLGAKSIKKRVYTIEIWFNSTWFRKDLSVSSFLRSCTPNGGGWGRGRERRGGEGVVG